MSMSTKPFVVGPDQRPPALHVMGARITPLAPETAMSDLQITYQTGEEGIGPPPHSHNWDESFFITKGQVLFTCDGNTSCCNAGTLVHVPARTVHAFSFGPGGGEILEITGKGSNAIGMFTEISQKMPSRPPGTQSRAQ
jgi:quercetin dioxygenase-like cupin family protein